MKPLTELVKSSVMSSSGDMVVQEELKTASASLAIAAELNTVPQADGQIKPVADDQKFQEIIGQVNSMVAVKEIP